MQCLSAAYANCEATQLIASAGGIGQARYVVVPSATGEACQVALLFDQPANPDWSELELLFQIPADEGNCGTGTFMAGFHSYTHARLTYLDRDGNVVVQEP